MRLVYYLFIFMVLFVGLFMLICGIFNVSSNDLEKKLKKRSSAKKKSNLDLKLNDLSEYISTKLKLNENKRAKLVSDLIAAGIDISPERYTSDAIVSALLVLPLSIPCAFVSPMLVLLVVFLSFLLFRTKYNKTTNEIHKRRELIESELPILCEFVRKRIKDSKNILDVLEEFIPMAGEELKKELILTIGDMKSSNNKMALLRLESRVGSSFLGDICRGLIACDRGEDNDAFWESTVTKLSFEERRKLKEKADNVPKKIKKLSFALMCCFMLMYIVVFGNILVSSLGFIL